LTYQFTATDADAADQSGLFLWSINWGDGSPIQTLSGPATISLTHVFNTSAIAGYTVTAIATDAGNNTSVPKTTLVQILNWQLQADPNLPGSWMLVVGGSLQGDRIRLTQHGSGDSRYYKLRIDSEYGNDYCDDEEENEFTVRIYSTVSGILVNAQSGDDRIEIQNGINIWSILDGGDGDDRIKAGEGANILVGGNGNDRLEGQRGRDLLIGGRGSDRIDGGKDDDLLISGYTSFDNNTAALMAIMREWNSSDSFENRRSQLMGTTPGGLNGSYLLKPSGTGRTVFDDNSLDELWGGEGRDWFLLNMNSAENCRVDRIRDWRNGDEDDDINLF
jgi:Ca2+-binding RTX toxin-like protein